MLYTRKHRENRGLCRQHVWVSQLSRGLFVRDELVTVMPLIVGQHDGDTVPKREVLPGDIKSLPVLARPCSADAGPDFLAALVFARGLAVIDEVSGCVWHRNVGYMIGDNLLKKKRRIIHI